MGTGERNAGGNPAMDWHPIQVGVEILLATSCYRNWDKFQPDGPLGSYADCTFFLPHMVQNGQLYILAQEKVCYEYFKMKNT